MKRYLISKIQLIDEFIKSSYAVKQTNRVFALNDVWYLATTVNHGTDIKVLDTKIFESHVLLDTSKIYKYDIYDISHYISMAVYDNNIAILYADDDYARGKCMHVIEELIDKCLPIFNDEHLTYASLLKGECTKIIFEGADYSGKTTLATKCLDTFGYAVQDRDLENVSLFIRQRIPINIISKLVRDNIAEKNALYVFMTTDDITIEGRKMLREPVSRFDDIATISNKLYTDLDIAELQNCKGIYVDDTTKSSYDQLISIIGGDN